MHLPMESLQYHQEGLRAFEVGDYESASRLFWSGLQLQESGELWNDWATARLQLGERSVAEQGFRRALEMNGHLPEAAINLGILLAGTNRYDEAINYLAKGRTGSCEPGAKLDELLQWCKLQATASGRKPAPGSAGGTAEQGGFRKVVMFPAPSRPPMTSSSSAGSGNSLFRSETPGTLAPAANAVDDLRAGMVFEGIVYGGSGYADESVAVLMGLRRRGNRIRLEAANQDSDNESILPPYVNSALDEMKHRPARLAECIHLHSAPAHDFTPGIFARMRIGRTMFETDRIPSSWVDRCQMMDEVWVPSEFNRETFQRAGVDARKLQVMPAGVDTSLFRPGLEPFPLPIADHFKFLSVFEWTARKGPDLLLRAFLREFKPDEGVALILRTYARPDATVDLVPRIAHFIEQEAGLTIETAPPVVVVSGFMKSADMPRLYNAADAFVLPSRGEGYGRPYMEALSCGLPVIGTAWSGQRDFLTSQNSFPVEIESVVPVPDETEVDTYFGHRWAQPSVEDLQRKMREVVSQSAQARSKAQLGRSEMVSRWDWNVVMEKWHERLQYLAG